MQDCRHCRSRPSTRRRGLCWVCYDQDEVRSRYAPLGAIGRQGALAAKPVITPTARPAAPCKHPPGSPERLATLAARVERGELLWHEDDLVQEMAR